MKSSTICLDNRIKKKKKIFPRKRKVTENENNVYIHNMYE